MGGSVSSPCRPSPYQLDLVTPGIIPLDANSRKAIRESLKRRMNARRRPLIWQRLTVRVGLASRGSCHQAQRSPSLPSTRRAWLAYLATVARLRLSRSIQEVFAIKRYAFEEGGQSNAPRRFCNGVFAGSCAEVKTRRAQRMPTRGRARPDARRRGEPGFAPGGSFRPGTRWPRPGTPCPTAARAGRV